MTTTTEVTPRQIAGLKDSLRSLGELARQVYDHDMLEPTDDDSDDWRAWDATMTVLIVQEQDARARLVKLLCTVATPPFALIVGDELIGLALEHSDDAGTAFAFSLPVGSIIHGGQGSGLRWCRVCNEHHAG
jgi:hypothetical protein